MKLQEINQPVENLLEMRDNKISLVDKMKEFYSVIEYYEKKGFIHKDDRLKIDTFKDFILDMVKQDEKRKED